MEKTKARIYYFSLQDENTAMEKRDWFTSNKIEEVPFAHIIPDGNNNWLGNSEDDFFTLLPLIDAPESIFSLYSLGVNSNRDEWVYDFNQDGLAEKMEFFVSTYNKLIEDGVTEMSNRIKWSSSLESSFNRKLKGSFSNQMIRLIPYRPFVKLFHYQEKIFNHRLTNNHYESFGKRLDAKNRNIGFISGMAKPFSVLSTENLVDLNFISPAAGGTQFVPFYRYDSSGNRLDNITDWGLEQFKNHYQDESIEKESIFHYVYAVLHNPAYRKKYELNLKREFPRIPFYENFAQWAAWGKELMDLHIGYETVEPWPLELVTAQTRPEMKKQKELFQTVAEPEPLYGYQAKPKVKLKADKLRGIIELDELSLLKGIPKEAWEYKLGNRSALEWILDQYKEKKPSDPTIAEKFNTYRFADYKEKVIDLLCRVCRVSVETVRIVGEMGWN